MEGKDDFLKRIAYFKSKFERNERLTDEEMRELNELANVMTATFKNIADSLIAALRPVMENLLQALQATLDTIQQHQDELEQKSCYVDGCTRNAGWLHHDEESGDMDSCAEHAGYEDWQEMQDELDTSITSDSYYVRLQGGGPRDGRMQQVYKHCDRIDVPFIDEHGERVMGHYVRNHEPASILPVFVWAGVVEGED